MYLLFAGEWYYPAGGIDDYVGTFATVEDAQKAFHVRREDWGQIVEMRLTSCNPLMVKILEDRRKWKIVDGQAEPVSEEWTDTRR